MAVVVVAAPCMADRLAAVTAAVLMAAGMAVVRMAAIGMAAVAGMAGTVDLAALTGTSTWARLGTRRSRGDTRATTHTMTAALPIITTIRRPRTGDRPARHRHPA